MGDNEEPRPLPHPAFPRALVVWGIVAMALDIGVSRITYGVLLPAIRGELQLSFTASGALSTVNLGAYLLGTLVGPALGRRWGMARLAAWGHVAMAAGLAVTALASEPVLFGLGRVVMGAGAGVGLLAVFVVIFARTGLRYRGTVSMAVWSGIGLAIVASGAAAPWAASGGAGWRAVFAVSAALALAVAAAFAISRSGSASVAAAPTGSFTASSAGRLRWLPLFAAYFMFGGGYIALSTFAGTKLAAEGAGGGAVATFWIVLGMGSMLGSLLGAFLLARPVLHRFALAIVLGSGLAGALVTGSGLAGAALAGSLLFGLSFASTPALITAFVRERTADADYPRTFAQATAALGTGQLFGPITTGALVDHLGPGAALGTAAAFYVLASGSALIDALGRTAQDGGAKSSTQSWGKS